MQQLREEYEAKLEKLRQELEARQEQMRQDMQRQIDDLQRLLEEEKMKMGAAGKAREDELLAEIANLRKELADRAARIDELKETLADKENLI